MSKLFEIQPKWCRAPLPKKDIYYSEWEVKTIPETIDRWERVLFFDPTDIYERIGDKIDPFRRIFSIPINWMFPSIEGFCSCGCGAELKGKGRRWATQHCSNFAWNVRNIICNAHQIPGFYISKYSDGIPCCDGKDRSNVQLDHIVGVKHGGGGAWLPNYQYLCHDCHRKKTNKDFGWNQKKPATQLNLFK